MATKKPNRTFATKSAKVPQDHKPPKDAVLEIETSVGVVKIRPMRITFGLMRQYKDSNEQTMVLSLIGDSLLDESQPVMDEIDETELEEFMEVWQEASGVDLGESSASSD